MEVIALKDGHYGGLYRNKYEKFEVAEGETASWFEPVDGKEAAPKAKTTAVGTGVSTKAKTAGDVNVV